MRKLRHWYSFYLCSSRASVDAINDTGSRQMGEGQQNAHGPPNSSLPVRDTEAGHGRMCLGLGPLGFASRITILMVIILRHIFSLDANCPGKWNASTSTSSSPCQARLPEGEPLGSTRGPTGMCLCNFETVVLHTLRQNIKKVRSLIKLQPSL